MRNRSVLIPAAALIAASGAVAHGAMVTTLASLNSATTGTTPYGNLAFDAAGNLYGTTSTGGAGGGGTIFQYSAGTGLTPKVSFAGTAGSGPYAGLTYSAATNTFYGTTAGTNNAPVTAGTIFSYAPGATAVTTLHTFNSATDGSVAQSPVTLANGTLYGTLQMDPTYNKGALYSIDPTDSSSYSTLYRFDGSKGQNPSGHVVVDAAGNVSGTTKNGGGVFRYNGTTGAVTNPTTFSNFGGTGYFPEGGLIGDAAGDLFGVTNFAGRFANPVLFELVGGTTYQTLATFASGTTGLPGTNYGGLTLDAAGDLFGTTASGGANGYGTVYELSAGSSSITTLYSFTNGLDGGAPGGGITLGGNGTLYGTTTTGGLYGNGTVYSVAVPEPASTALVGLGGLGLLGGRRRSHRRA